MSVRFEIISHDAASGPLAPAGTAWLIGEKKKLHHGADAADAAMGGALSRLAASPKFTGKAMQVVSGIGADGTFHLLAGIGKDKEATVGVVENAGGTLLAEANRLGLASLTVHVGGVGELSGAETAARLLHGARLRSYRFDRYRTRDKADDRPTLMRFAVAVADGKAAAKALRPLDALAAGIELTRDVVSEPPNILHPESYAGICQELEADGLKVTVLGEKEMAELGMGSLLGVGQGSVRESKMVILEWHGGGKKDAPLAFVGKGVTFDTGGISIKPAKGMEEMKWDMGGSGTVVGLMKALALRGAKVNAIGAVGLVENMPDGNAIRPGDVLTSMSGQTIEVLNTDAEGRLVLADVLWYVQDRFKPRFMIDLATLTGAIIVSLGQERAGLFSNSDELAERIHALGEKLGERVWRLPLGEEYDKQLDCAVADMQNIGADREAGSITAAQFLQRFVNGVPWVHLDIAGVAWSRKDKPTVPKGATAWGVKLLDAFVAEYE